MSYLGLGIQPPEPSLGRMLYEAQSYLFNAPWYAIGPGVTIIDYSGIQYGERGAALDAAVRRRKDGTIG